MRYGQRVQQERQNAQQSLFGGGDVVDIQPPTTPVAQDWNQLMVLNKEREVIGLYLSAHPLDDYKVIINNMCKVSLNDLNDMSPLEGKEIALAGVVTAVQELTTKTGKNWGKFTMEDYDGSYEFTLFGEDYKNFRPYLFPNYFLFVKGRVQLRPYRDNGELEFKIKSMVQLSDVRDTLIKEIYLSVDIDDIDDEFITSFTKVVKANKGKTILRMTVVSRRDDVALNLYSRRHKVALTQELIDYLEKRDIKFTLS
jgi:DNA polymerase-3 subunit alpha